MIWIASGDGHADVPDLLGGPVQIEYCYVNDSTDLAILRTQQILNNGNSVEMGQSVVLDTRPPTPGTPILALGYTKIAVTRDETDPDDIKKRSIAAEQAFHASHGEVTQVYGEGRDSAMLPFPCFESSARFDAGMSGGPVFSGESGFVCGVVCAGLDEGAGSETFVSWSSLVAPLLALRVAHDEETGEEETLYELIDRGAAAADPTFRRIRISEPEPGVKTIEF